MCRRIVVVSFVVCVNETFVLICIQVFLHVHSESARVPWTAAKFNLYTIILQQNIHKTRVQLIWKYETMYIYTCIKLKQAIELNACMHIYCCALVQPCKHLTSLGLADCQRSVPQTPGGLHWHARIRSHWIRSKISREHGSRCSSIVI